MLRVLLTLVLLIVTSTLVAQTPQYEKDDSVRIESLLKEAPTMSDTNAYMLYFGRKLTSTPYVAGTLDRDTNEHLIINTRELDCTTFTETVLALTLCKENNKTGFEDFASYLRSIRYHEGRVAYASRQHYFTAWIDEARENGFISEHDYPESLSPQQRTLTINYMSTHASAYKQIKDNETLRKEIAETEERISGRVVSYIPKSVLNKYSSLKKCIHDGDIIAIITNKAGLDISHIGIASWHKDGTLHLLNASQIHKKVVDESKPLYDYMHRHPSQIGIRVLHVN